MSHDAAPGAPGLSGSPLPAGGRVAPVAGARYGLGPKGGSGGARLGDRVFRALVTAFGVAVLVVPAMMLVQLALASRLALETFGPAFLVGRAWNPVAGEFGALPFVFGTVVSSLLALALAVPVSLGVAICLSELAPPKLRGPLGFLVELLAAIPSVVYGFWGIFVLVPLLRNHVEPFLAEHLGFLPFFRGAPLGFGMLAAGCILAIMIVPTITSIARDVLRAVPDAQREAAYGLGASPWDAIRHAVLPAAKSGVVGAVILGLGRALGETMAVTMVIGNRPQISASLFDPAYSMASVLANEFAEADSDLYLSALSEIALLLLGVALVLNLLARWLVHATARRVKGEPA